MAGKPVIQGTRLTAEYILGLLAHGSTMEEILEEYPGLVKDDIYAFLLFASKTLQDASFIPLAAEERRMALKPQIPIPQTTDQSEPPLHAEFVAETIQAIAELDSGLGKTFSSKKEFLDDLEHL